MIQAGLPAKKTMKNATKTEFLAAICAAVRKNRSAAATIAPAAISARREYIGEVVGTVLRCSVQSDCKLAGEVVAATVLAEGAAVTAIADAAIATAPDCGDAIQDAARRAASGPNNQADSNAVGSDNQSSLPGSGGGVSEGFDPRERLILVCGNGTQRTVRESQLDGYLASHPGSFVGSCPPTPTPSAKK